MYVFHFIKRSCKNLLWLLKHILLKICSLWKILPSGDHTIFHKIVFERWAYISVIPRKISQKFESKLVVILEVFQNNYTLSSNFWSTLHISMPKCKAIFCFAAHFCNFELLRVVITWKLLCSERLTFSGGGGILVFGWCGLLSHPPVRKSPVLCRCFFLEIQGRPFRDTSACLLMLFNVLLLSVIKQLYLNNFQLNLFELEELCESDFFGIYFWNIFWTLW